MSKLIQRRLKAENKAYKILGQKILKVWLKAKDKLRLILRLLLGSYNHNTDLGLHNFYITNI